MKEVPKPKARESSPDDHQVVARGMELLTCSSTSHTTATRQVARRGAAVCGFDMHVQRVSSEFSGQWSESREWGALTGPYSVRECHHMQRCSCVSICSGALSSVLWPGRESYPVFPSSPCPLPIGAQPVVAFWGFGPIWDSFDPFSLLSLRCIFGKLRFDGRKHEHLPTEPTKP